MHPCRMGSLNGNVERGIATQAGIMLIICQCRVTGGEDTEEVLGWATGAKYDLKKPALFGV